MGVVGVFIRLWFIPSLHSVRRFSLTV